ncbi:hypothetical protein LCAA2362_0828 [Lacticaseibacillus casei A2-362]|nr:hypothetical protein LCAA2362_0828 [Lacticaseibacillus casei A2-362]
MTKVHADESLKRIKALTEEVDKQISTIQNADRQDTEIRLLLKNTTGLVDNYKHEKESENYRLLMSSKPELMQAMDENIDSIISDAQVALKRARRSRLKATVLYAVQIPLCVLILLGVISLFPSFRASILDQILIKPKHLEIALKIGFLTGAFLLSISNGVLGIYRLWTRNQSIADTVNAVMGLSTRISIVIGIAVFSLQAFNVTQFAALSSLISIFTLFVIIIPRSSLSAIRRRIHEQRTQHTEDPRHNRNK